MQRIISHLTIAEWDASADVGGIPFLQIFPHSKVPPRPDRLTLMSYGGEEKSLVSCRGREMIGNSFSEAIQI